MKVRVVRDPRHAGRVGELEVVGDPRRTDTRRGDGRKRGRRGQVVTLRDERGTFTVRAADCKVEA